MLPIRKHFAGLFMVAAVFAAASAVAQDLDALTLDDPDEEVAPAAPAAAGKRGRGQAAAGARGQDQTATVPETGVALRFYRNFFPMSLKALADFDALGLEPDYALTLPGFTLLDPRTRRRDIRITRCYGAILDAWVTARYPGEYRLVVPTGGGASAVFVSEGEAAPEPLAFKAETLRGMPEFELGQRHNKTLEKARVSTKSFRLKAGGRLKVHALFVPGGDDRFFVGWTRRDAVDDAIAEEAALSLDGAAPQDPEFEAFPKACLTPAPVETRAPRITAGNPSVPIGIHPADDEPDSLCWELFADDPVLVRHFLDWAATNQPPEGAGPSPATAGASSPASPRPFVWLKTAEAALTTNNGLWSNTNFVKGAGVVALRGPDGHAGARCHFDAVVTEEGDYRVWCRFWRPRPTAGGSFNLDVMLPPSANPADDGVEAVIPLLSHTFARTNLHPYRPLDPTPDIMSTPYPPDGWAWEGSRRTARLRPGRYRIVISNGEFQAQPGAVVSDVVLTADPMVDVSAVEPRAASCSGSLPLSAEAASPLFAIRPGADLDAAPPARLAWWRRWRDALYDRLRDAEYSDYDWGYLATLNCLDEDSNLIGRVREVRTQRSDDARAPAPPPVGDGDLAFWEQNPFGAFSRTSPPASGYRQLSGGGEEWTPLPPEELGRTNAVVEAISGEVKSRLVLVRNNRDSALVIRPAVEGALPCSVRLVAYTVTSGGLWSPQILLRREEVVCPPHQNTALWVTVDCRGAAEGDYPVTLRFADRAVTWRVEVRGTFEGVPKPWLCPHAAPYPRMSSWELFRDYGLDVVRYMPISRKAMEEYGIRLLLGGRYYGITPEGVRKTIAEAEARGLRPGDYAWFPSDEPSPEAVPKWIEMAQVIKDVDPNQWIWCDLGEGIVSPELEDVFFPMMEYWDVACPFVSHFSHEERYRRYREKLRVTGKVKLVYHTLDVGSREKKLTAPLEILNLAAFAAREGREGFCNFSMLYGQPYDDLYTDNQDHAVSIYPGSRGRTLSTRNLEAFREGGQRMRRAWRDAPPAAEP